MPSRGSFNFNSKYKGINLNAKIAVSVLCGGQSTEHEVSIRSAMNVIAALDTAKYDVSVVYIDHQGAWYYIQNSQECLQRGPIELVKQARVVPVTVLLGENGTFISTQDGTRWVVDCVIPMLHGTYCEDGNLQGLLQLMNVAYVGSDTLSSAICMDKDITKQILHAHKIPTTPWQMLHPNAIVDGLYPELVAKFGKALFIKPVNLGSSVGAERVDSEAEFLRAAQSAFQYAEYLMVEPYIKGREIECAVLGNDYPIASLPSEIIPHHRFYTYYAKYIDPNGATTVAPADLSERAIEKIRHLSVEAFKVLRCRGMLRVDFFMLNDDEIMINEVNTIPGFTNISMYPKMWEVSGISYSKLIDQLIGLSLERHQRERKLQRVYQRQESEVALDQRSYE